MAGHGGSGDSAGRTKAWAAGPWPFLSFRAEGVGRAGAGLLAQQSR